MKALIREVVTYALSLFIVSLFLKGLIIEYELSAVVVGGVFLTIAFKFINPIIGALGAPLKLITLGFFSFLTTAASLFVITLVYQGIRVVPFDFPALSLLGISTPSFHANLILSYVLVSATIYLTSKAIAWLYDR